MKFGEWHEAYLESIGNQIALGIDRMQSRADEEQPAPVGQPFRAAESVGRPLGLPNPPNAAISRTTSAMKPSSWTTSI
jgi:hypothetical protein